jgi:hypothetical protein
MVVRYGPGSHDAKEMRPMQVCKAARFGCSGPAVPRNLEAVAPSRVANGYDAWDSDAGAG